MKIKDMPFVTVEQVNALREAAVKLEYQAELYDEVFAIAKQRSQQNVTSLIDSLDAEIERLTAELEQAKAMPDDDQELETLNDLLNMPLYVCVADEPHGPGEVFVEIETASGVGVTVPSERIARGRRIGPLYLRSPKAAPVAVPDGAGILPCPFCGSADVEAIGLIVDCMDCTARVELVGINPTTDDAVNSWNRRAAPPVPAVPRVSPEDAPYSENLYEDDELDLVQAAWAQGWNSCAEQGRPAVDEQWRPIHSAPVSKWILVREHDDVYKARLVVGNTPYWEAACGQPVSSEPAPLEWRPLP